MSAARRPARRRALLAIAWSSALGLLSGLLLLLVALPLAGLLFSAPPRQLLAGLSDPLVAPALRLTLFTTTVSLLVILTCGTPLAWLIARRTGGAVGAGQVDRASRASRIWRMLETLVELPAVLPPAVAGVALLLAFGRRGLLGPGLAAAGIGLPFTRAAVVVAQTFVAAPFYLQAAIAAFRRLDPDLILVARTLGASPPRLLFTVAIPVSWPSLAGGAAMSWARALGEFGATLMFAGNMSGRTQTLPLAIYTALESDLRTAQSLSILLVAIAFGLLVAIRAGARR
ncbi:MAG TPA: ABC transporter permease subunit [Polyangia bacterium]|nr:ABC transporter permease subunit [Polyangia bacterium]